MIKLKIRLKPKYKLQQPLCKIEESRLKEKTDVGSSEKNQSYATMTKRRKFEEFGP